MKIISILVVLVLSLMVAQAAKAQTTEDILFNDLGDTISVSPSSNPPVTIVLGCQTGTPNLDICKIALLRAGQTITGATGNFTINATSTNPVSTSYFLSESTNPNLLSDTFISIIVGGATVLGVTAPGSAAFEFDSDSPLLEGVPVPCPAVIGCNAQETGQPQLVGTITWSGGITDNILIESDKEGVVPEPASLLLLGSGLAMTGGFLRRRLRLA